MPRCHWTRNAWLIASVVQLRRTRQLHARLLSKATPEGWYLGLRCLRVSAAPTALVSPLLPKQTRWLLSHDTFTACTTALHSVHTCLRHTCGLWTCGLWTQPMHMGMGPLGQL